MAVSSFPLLFTILVLLVLLPSASSQDYALYTACSGSNYTSSSPYASTLQRLLTNISTSVSQSTSFFATAVSGDPSSPIFALAQCRPDISATMCDFCINNSISTAKNSSSEGCPLRRSAALRYDYCVIRYSDQPFFGIATDERKTLVNPQRVTNPAEFEARARALMSEVAVEAADAETSISVKKTTGKGLVDLIYGLAWCTMDLSNVTCLKCLQDGIPSLYFEQVGARVNSISCYLRFEITPFYLADVPFSTTATEQSSSPGATTNVGENGTVTVFDFPNNEKNASKRRIISLVSIALAAAIALV